VTTETGAGSGAVKGTSCGQTVPSAGTVPATR
jgi:hypothetical protein